jgi:GUN4-like/NACHT domain/Sulfatase-modifying factor enzyme 1
MPEQTPEKSLSDKIADAAIKLLVVGSGGYAVYSLVDDEIPKALISGAVSVGAALMTSYWEGLMKVLKEGMSKRGEKSGQAIDQGFTESTARLQDWISHPEQKYLEALKVQCERIESEGEALLGGISLKDVYVPLQVISQQDQVISRAPRQIWAFLPPPQSRELQHRRIAIAAGAGSGKTTLLRYLTLCYVTGAYRQHQVREFMPVLLRFRDIFKEIPPEGTIALPDLILKSLAKQPEGENFRASKLWFEDQLKDGRCLVMFDGLDEVPKSQRHRIKQWVDYQMKRYGKTRFILTSRPAGLELEDDASNARIEVDTSLQVLPFNPDEIEQFVRQWYRSLITQDWQMTLRENLRRPEVERLSEEAVQDEIERQVKEKAESLTRQIFASSALTGLARNPLLVKMIAVTHQESIELPRRRVALYREICDVLLRKRAAKFSDRRTPLELDDKLALLQLLAWNLMQQEVNTFCYAQGIQWIQERFRQACADEAIKPKQFLTELIEIVGLIVEQEHDTYEFSHLTFQEYFAALYLKAQGQESVLVEKVSNDRWLEVSCFSASLGKTAMLVNAALDVLPTAPEEKKPHLLKLIIRCRNEGVPLDSATRQRLEPVLEQAVRDSGVAAEILLQQRFESVIHLDQQVYLCPNYTTWAEYQLFLNAQETKQYHSQAQQINVPLDKLNEPVSGISWQDAQWFCNWLSSLPALQAPGKVCDYRLPTATELETISSSAIHRLIPFSDAPERSGNSIKVVRVQLPKRYQDLHNYLANGRWKDADEATDKVMLEVVNRTEQRYLDVESIQKFPCKDLQIIDRLWVKFSLGHFGFSVQKQIYVETGNSLDGRYHEEAWERFCDRVGWRMNEDWISYSDVVFDDTTSNWGHLPFWTLGRGTLLFVELELRGGEGSLLSRRDL